MDPKVLRIIIAGIGLLFMLTSWIILLDYSHYHCSATDQPPEPFTDSGGPTIEKRCFAAYRAYCVEQKLIAFQKPGNYGSITCPYREGSVIVGGISLLASMIFLGFYGCFAQLRTKTIIGGAVAEFLLLIGTILMFVDIRKGSNNAAYGRQSGTQSIFIVGASFALIGFLDVAIALFMSWRANKKEENYEESKEEEVKDYIGEYTSVSIGSD